MPYLLEKRDRWGRGIAVWILAAMVLLLPPALWAVSKMEMRNDVTSWLQDDDPQAQKLAEFHRLFPKKDRLILTWDGCSLGDPRIEQLAVHLQGIPDSNNVPQGGSPYIDRVFTPNTLLKQMPAVDLVTAIDRLDGILLGRGPLRLELTEAGRARGRFLIDDLQKLASEQLKIDVQVVDTDEDKSWITPTLAEVSIPNVDAEKRAGTESDGSGEGDLEDEDFGETSDNEDDEGESEDNAELQDYLAHKPPFDVALQWEGMHADPAVIDRFIQLAKAMRGKQSVAEPTGALMIRDCFFHDGSMAALAISLTEAGVEERKQALATIRETAAGVGVAPETLRMGGSLVAASELNQAVKRAAWDTSFPVWDMVHRSPVLFSFLVSVIFSFVLLRSMRLALLVMIASQYTVILAMSLVPLSGGYMNMVLVVMPTLLMVLTTSAGIHLANYWRHAAQAGDGVDANFAAVMEAAKAAAKPCILASFTTAVGLLSLCTSSLVPVRDFGIYSAIGCLISLAVVLYGLPSLMLYWQSRTPAERELRSGSWNNFGSLIYRFRTQIVVACALVGIVATSGLVWFKTETKVIRYFPDDSRIVKDYRYIEGNLCGIVPVDTVVRFDAEGQKQTSIIERMEIVRRIANQMKSHRDISGVISLATFRPENEPLPENASAFKKITHNAAAKKMQETLLGGLENQPVDAVKTPAQSFIALDDSQSNLNDRPDELWRISAQVAIMSDLDYGVLMDDLDRIAQSELKLVGSPRTSHWVTGLVPVFLRTQQAVLESLVRSFGLAFLVIAGVMMVLLRNPLAGVITMIPNLLPVFAVFGVISYFDIRIDIGTMITASVALGIAVDGTLHLLTWFRRHLELGATRQEAVSRALEHCGPAMLQTSAAIGLGMLTLLPVDLLLISRFGWLMSALIGAALIADVVLLPALLSGALGSLIETTVLRAKDPNEDKTFSDDDENEIPQPHVGVGDDKALRHRAG
jgi:predicted RND superfamily exporter protein